MRLHFAHRTVLHSPFALPWRKWLSPTFHIADAYGPPAAPGLRASLACWRRRATAVASPAFVPDGITLSETVGKTVCRFGSSRHRRFRELAQQIDWRNHNSACPGLMRIPSVSPQFLVAVDGVKLVDVYCVKTISRESTCLSSSKSGSSKI